MITLEDYKDNKYFNEIKFRYLISNLTEIPFNELIAEKLDMVIKILIINGEYFNKIIENKEALTTFNSDCLYRCNVPIVVGTFNNTVIVKSFIDNWEACFSKTHENNPNLPDCLYYYAPYMPILKINEENK